MAESKKKPPIAEELNRPRQNSQAPGGMFVARGDGNALSALQLVDFIASEIATAASSLMDLIYLRDRVAAMEEMNDQARQALEKLDEIVEKLRSPAFRVGTFSHAGGQ